MSEVAASLKMEAPNRLTPLAKEKLVFETLRFAIPRSHSFSQALGSLNKFIPVTSNAETLLNSLVLLLDQQNISPKSNLVSDSVSCNASSENKANSRLTEAIYLKKRTQISQRSSKTERKRARLNISPQEIISIPDDDASVFKENTPDTFSDMNLPPCRMFAYLHEFAKCLFYDFVSNFDQWPLPESLDSSLVSKILNLLRIPLSADWKTVQAHLSIFKNFLQDIPAFPPTLSKEDLKCLSNRLCCFESALRDFFNMQDECVQRILIKADGDGLPALLNLPSTMEDSQILVALSKTLDLLSSGRLQYCKDAKVALQKLTSRKEAWDKMKSERFAQGLRDTEKLKEKHEAVNYVLDRISEAHHFGNHPTIPNQKHFLYYFYVIGIDPTRVDISTFDKIGRKLKSLLHPDSLPQEVDKTNADRRAEAFKMVNTAVEECKQEIKRGIPRTINNWKLPPEPPYVKELLLQHLGMRFKESCKFSDETRSKNASKDTSWESKNSRPKPVEATKCTAEFASSNSSFPEPQLQWLPNFSLICTNKQSCELKINLLPNHPPEAIAGKNVYVYTLRPMHRRAPPASAPPNPRIVCTAVVHTFEMLSTDHFIITSEGGIQPWELGTAKKYWIGVQCVYKRSNGETAATQICWKSIEIKLEKELSLDSILTLLDTFSEAEFINQAELQGVLQLSKRMPIPSLKGLLDAYCKKGREWADGI
ncbi:hypothetical protein IE077_004338 [Cardiosporidium cionae]|uniref:J domain-containing protein n=1 Tax=Cardiosporidium cionae TaxID=476202 RepID=A0ABQ7JBP0_9APIC|nr:hypothetical protein IE077_004338 [Cardiosporidium cionae]|eukprot:KAF8821407.1 hypothetical protein IE077_004338 [Cardiosporidium cionae]